MIITQLIKNYSNAKRKLILLDYDGTLVNFAPTPDAAVPTQRLLDILTKLCARRDTRLVIITGRGKTSIDRLLGHLPVDIVAEHGAMIKLNNEWRKVSENREDWKEEILKKMNEFVTKNAGSFIETKEYALTWHYRQVPEETGLQAAEKLIESLQDTSAKYDLKIINGNKVVEIVAGRQDKGVAALKFVQEQDYDFVLAIGDDRTDEDMFLKLQSIQNCYTVKVGPGNTSARHQLFNVQEVLLLLEQI
jgi:trehalose 6-phosphate synthase/phosphatase